MGTSKTKTAIIAALTTAIPTFASPQGGAGATGGAGGLQVDLGVSSTLRVDDNFQQQPDSSGTTTIWDNRLSFGLTSIGTSQRLSFTGTGVLRFAEIPGRSVSGFEDPTLRFSYSADAANSRFTFDARYRSADREFLDPFQVEREEQLLGVLVGEGGTLTTSNLRFSYETGLNDPIGFRVTGSRADRDYADVTNPSLFDATTNDLALSTIFRVSPVTQITATAAQTWYDASDAPQTSRDTTDFSLGLRTDVTQTLVLDARIGYVDIQIDDLAGTPSRSGATGSVGLTQTLTNGDASVSLALTRNQNGDRTTLTFGRSYQLKNGTLAGTLGVSEGPTGATDVIASLSYSEQLKSSNFSVSLRRTANTNTQDVEVVDTRLTVGYGYDIDAISRISVTFDYGRTEDDLGALSTVERASLRAAYTRQLTADWNLQGGVLLPHISDRAWSGSAQPNSILLTLDRSFSFRP